MSQNSLIRALAAHRGLETGHPETRFDHALAIAFTCEDGRWIPSYESTLLAETKKVNVETGEDQQST
jgi:hypothetical protein